MTPTSALKRWIAIRPTRTRPHAGPGQGSAASTESVTATLIAHACVLLRAGSMGLLSDPWLDGEIFNRSWRPLFPTGLRDDELASLTHIWISHEHPDHLHFPSLRAIPAEARARITLLYQRHPQRAVVETLRKQGFREVVELEPGRWCELTPGVEVACFPSRRIDSALALRAGGVTVLNLNDCKIGDHYLRQIGRALGPIDLLLGQYSIAGWIGNRAQPVPDKRLKVIRRTAHYCHLLRPRALGLFASHAWFCHEENAHMNDWAVSPREALAFMAAQGPSNLKVHALMPRDRWLTGTGFVGVDDGLSAWDVAIARRRSEGLVARELVPLDDLLKAASAYLAQLRNAVAEGASRPSPAQPLDLHVEDLGVSLRLSLRDFTLSEQPVPRANCHLSLGSQALANCFLFRWGFDTLDTSGRYTLQRPPKDHPVLLHCYAHGAAYGTGLPFGWHERVARLLARRGEWLDERMKR